MTTYQINTFDVCTQGFERLRSQDEFILTASIDADTTASDLRDEWLDDIQSCAMDDDFDYDAANAAVTTYVNENLEALFARRTNPFDLEPSTDGAGYDEGCIAFLYLEPIT